MARRETLRERLQRPGRTVAGRLIRGAISAAPTIAAVGSIAFPAASGLVVGAMARLRAAKQNVRDTVQQRQAEVETRTRTIESGQTKPAFDTYTRGVGFFARLPRWLIFIVPISIFALLLLPTRKTYNKPNKGRNKGRNKTRKAVKANAPLPIKKSTPVGGFSRKLKGKVYTDPKAWANAMKNLRKKK